MTKKKTTTKAATKKKAPALAELPEPEARAAGETVHTWRAPRDRAIEWVRDFGYRVADDQGERVIIEGDAIAHGRMVDHGRISNDDSGAGDE